MKRKNIVVKRKKLKVNFTFQNRRNAKHSENPNTFCSITN